MAATTPAQARLYVLLARLAPRAVIFRRGPSKTVLMITWDTEHDRFQEGQWLRGHLYERRCDLSPSGALLVYFAAKYKRYLSQLGRVEGAFPTWTAVCRPPYFTALCLWPNHSAWNGGGLFESEGRLLLNHGSRVPACAPGLEPPPPSRLEIVPLGGPHGEDDTVQHPRLLRDGWSLVEAGRSIHQPRSNPHFVYSPPKDYCRPQPGETGRQLHRIVRGLGSENGPWYLEEFRVEDPKRGWSYLVEGAEWADWDRTGDLLFARRGAIHRLRQRDLKAGPAAAVELADFAACSFANRRPPAEASRW